MSDWANPEYLGTLNPKVWSDIDTEDLSTISSLPSHALHRNTEEFLWKTAAENSDKVNIAIMCPPDIYGRGTGLGKTSSALVPMFIADAKNVAGGKPFYYGDGGNTRSWVHISDLTSLYLRVVEAAATHDPAFASPAPGYYFAGTQEHSHLTVARAIGSILKKEGVVEDAEPVRVELEVIDRMARHPRFEHMARYLYASNSRTRPERAKRAFGYVGKQKGLLECLEGDVLAALGRG